MNVKYHIELRLNYACKLVAEKPHLLAALNNEGTLQLRSYIRVANMSMQA